MSVGAELREARLQAGLSREDVAQRTRIQLAKIEALEADAFERLPEGIYLQGLVRAYANELGLDGEEFAARLRVPPDMAPAVSEADISGTDPDSEIRGSMPDIRQSGEPDFPPESVYDFPTESEHVLPTEELAARNIIRATDEYGHENAVRSESDYINRDYIVAPPHPDYITPASERLRLDSPRDADYLTSPTFLTGGQPPERRRTAGFLLPVLALIGAFLLGAYLYDRYRPFDSGELTLAVSHDDDDAPAEAAATNRDPDAVTADAAPADRPGTAEHHGDPPLDAPQGPTPSAERRTSGANGPGASKAYETASDTSRSAATGTGNAAIATGNGVTPAGAAHGGADAREGARTTPGDFTEWPVTTRGVADTPPAAPAANVADLSGEWALDTRVEASTVRDYEGLRLGYQIELQQAGDRITGEGVKLLENGKTIVGFARTPIIVQGTLEGTRLTLTFIERGRRRESGGKMILDVHEDGVLRGRFASSAAGSSGIVEARRPRS